MCQGSALRSQMNDICSSSGNLEEGRVSLSSRIQAQQCHQVRSDLLPALGKV